MEPILQKIIDRIRSCGKFLIASHVRPDGDAVGSELALYHLLRAMGKEVDIYSQDPIPRIYAFLPGSEAVAGRIKEPERYDAAFLLDCSEMDRIGDEADAIAGVPLLINIDHHVSNRAFCEPAWIDAKASSTGEMIFRLAEALGAEITPEVAVNLYTAIVTDTGSFRYTNTSAETLKIAAELVEKGADPHFVAENVYESTPIEKVRLLAKALATLEFEWQGRIGSILVSQDMFTQAGARPEHADSFADFVRGIAGVEVGVFYTEMPDGRYKVGFRSKGRVDVERIASRFGGGGHAAAAACRIDGDFAAIKREVNQAIMAVRI